jgi:hypothetical protein
MDWDKRTMQGFGLESMRPHSPLTLLSAILVMFAQDMDTRHMVVAVMFLLFSTDSIILSNTFRSFNNLFILNSCYRNLNQQK